MAKVNIIFASLALSCCALHAVVSAVELRKAAEFNLTSVDRIVSGRPPPNVGDNVEAYRVQTNRTTIYRKPIDNLDDVIGELTRSATGYTRIANAGELGFHAYQDRTSTAANQLFSRYDKNQQQPINVVPPSNQYENASFIAGGTTRYRDDDKLVASGQYSHVGIDNNATGQQQYSGQAISGGKYGQQHQSVVPGAQYDETSHLQSSINRQYDRVKNIVANNKYGNNNTPGIQQQYGQVQRLKPSNQYNDAAGYTNNISTYSGRTSLRASHQYENATKILTGSHQYETRATVAGTGQYSSSGNRAASPQYGNPQHKVQVTNQYNDSAPGLYLRGQYNESQQYEASKQYDKNNNSNIRDIYNDEQVRERHRILLGQRKLSAQLDQSIGEAKQVAQVNTGSADKLRQQSRQNVQIGQQSGTGIKIDQRNRDDATRGLAEQNRRRVELQQLSQAAQRIDQQHDVDSRHLQQQSADKRVINQQNIGSRELQQQHADTRSLQQQNIGSTQQLRQNSGVGVELLEQNRRRVQLEQQNQAGAELQQQSKADAVQLKQQNVGGVELKQQNRAHHQLAEQNQGGSKLQEQSNVEQKIAQQNRVGGDELRQQSTEEASKLAQAHAGGELRLVEQSVASKDVLLGKASENADRRQTALVGTSQYDNVLAVGQKQYGSENRDTLVVADVLASPAPSTGHGEVVVQRNSTTIVTRHNHETNSANPVDVEKIAQDSAELDNERSGPKLFSV